MQTGQFSQPNAKTEKPEISETGEPQTVQVPILYKFDREYQTHYANQVTIQNNPHEIIISFFAIAIEPERPDKPAEFSRKLQQNGVEAHCLTRIVVAKTFFPELAEMLNQQMPPPTEEQMKELVAQFTEEKSEDQEVSEENG